MSDADGRNAIERIDRRLVRVRRQHRKPDPEVLRRRGAEVGEAQRRPAHAVEALLESDEILAPVDIRIRQIVWAAAGPAGNGIEKRQVVRVNEAELGCLRGEQGNQQITAAPPAPRQPHLENQGP
jgi:hypothetical protein